jgi:dihydrofolate synthase/folylpolyglutamate synthase
MAFPPWWRRLPRPVADLRAIDRLARELANHERSAAFHRGEVGLSLRASRRFVRWLGDPLRGVPLIHVAGSKGKGSVCLLTDALLRAQGLRTGVYLSPHVDAWNERIQVGGRPLPPRRFGQHVERVLRIAARHGAPAPTLFETLTAAAFDAFRAARVDVAIVEVGIGGRLDATNVVAPDVAIVTALEREHVKVLGATLAKIAWQKAGIFKRGAAAVSGVDASTPAAAVLRRAARRQGTRPFLEWGRDLDVRNEGERIVVERAGRPPLALPRPAGGPFAARNAALAVVAVEELARRRPKLRIDLGERALARGLRAARLPGRLELVLDRPRTWRDGAHTPASLAAVVGAVAAEAGRPPCVVLALKSDKPLARCLAAMQRACGPLVATVVPGGRSHAPEVIVAAARRRGIMATSVRDPAAALAFARRRAGPRGAVLVTGSFWLAGATKPRPDPRRPLGTRRPPDPR